MADETQWPEWDGAGDDLDGYRLLARYVSAEAVDGLGLTDTTAVERWQAAGRGKEAERAAKVETARNLYRNLLGRRIPYRIEEWTIGDGQRVRHPQKVAEDGGTCLDLAVFYAALLLEADIAPLLAVGEGARSAGASDHVFVLVDPDPKRDRASMAPPPFLGRSSAQELDHRSGPTIRDHGLVAVDVTCATRGLASPFDQACAEGERQLGDYRRLVVVDVASLQNRDARCQALERPRSSAAIFRRLPAMPRFQSFPSRKDLLERVRGSKQPRTVLYGDQGTGKSMLAHQVALEADRGYGWFLTATDRTTLVTALSDAYLTEATDSRAEGLDNLEREGFAQSALQLLQDSTAPWVVVLDNANCPPGDLQGWIPVPHAPGQRVIVTTTNPDWRKEDDLTSDFEVVPALDDADVAGLLRHDERLLRLARGRPLLAVSFGRLLERLDPDGGTAALAARLASVPEAPADDEMAGPRALWAVARDEVDGDARRTARALSWLPPDDVPVAAALEPLVPDVHDALGQLAGAGVVAFKGARLATAVVSTHRLYLRAIREHPEDRRAGLDMLDDILAADGARALLDEQADQETINLVAAELLTAYGAAPAGGSVARALRWAARLQELHGAIEQSSASYGAVATRLLAELGEAPGRPLVGPVGRAPDDYDVLADSLHGRTRYAFHHSTDLEALRGADDDCSLAVAIKTAFGDEGRMGAARSEALRGLILRKLANLGPEEERLAGLEAALKIIEDSARTREDLEGEGTAEVARAVFNLGGTRLGLAKQDRERAAYHLEKGRSAYQRSLDIRNDVYARKRHPHIAASRNGLGLMDYYQAQLVEGLGRSGVTEALRAATKHLYDAMTDREALDGNVDGADTRKSAEVLVKALLTRIDVVTPGGAAEVMEDARRELEEFNRHFRPAEQDPS